jgi:tRNA threonylcarbamoyladenosine biosynthesis protein TsaE
MRIEARLFEILTGFFVLAAVAYGTLTAVFEKPGGFEWAGTTALVHLDLYRLEPGAAADELFAQEEEDARGLGAVLAVEWPERLSFRPQGAWEVALSHREDGEGRVALITPPGFTPPGFTPPPAAPPAPR